MTARTILVLGGSGIFGGRVAKALAETPGLSVVIAGRNAAAGSAAGARIGAGYVACDLGREGALRAALASVAPALLIHAAGPFQGARYDVALACIEAGVHYLDLADARAFVSGIGALDGAARARGVAVGSGASSVPTITHALATELAAGFERIDALQIALSPGNQNPRGASTIAAILGSLGKTQAVWTDGRWRAVPCWGDRRRLAFPPSVGERDVYACDVPDLELFPQAFGARTVRFHAGLELRVLNAALSALRALRAAHLVPPLAPLAPLALRVSLTLYSRGSKNGALAVWARGAPRGAPAEAGLVERGLALVTDDDGPATPSSPAILLARKLLLGGGLPAGAYPCMGLLELDEILAHLAPLGIACLRDGGDGRWSARPAR